MLIIMEKGPWNTYVFVTCKLLKQLKKFRSDDFECITNLLPEGALFHFAFPLCNRPDLIYNY